MPKLKRKAPAMNLGGFAKKKQKIQVDTGDSDGNASRSSTPESYEEPDYPALVFPYQNSLTSSEDSIVSVDMGADVPSFETENALRKWLKLGKTKLTILKAKLAANTEEPAKTRGPYFKTRLGAAPAARTVRLQRQRDRDLRQQHGAGILRFFKKAGTPDSEEVEVVAPPAADVISLLASSEESSAYSELDAGTVSLSCSQFGPTIDDDEDDIEQGSLAQSELSRLEEDGLGDIEEILAAASGQEDWDDDNGAYDDPEPPQPSPPASVPTPDPNGPTPVRHQVRVGPPSVQRADDTFRPKLTIPRFGHQPPNSEIVNETIKKIHTILRPPRGPHTRGFKHADLNMVLRGRLELMLSFLRLYAGSGYAGWGRAADTIAKSAGKGFWMSRRIRQWVLAFMKDETDLPHAQYGKFNASILEDEDLSEEIHLHLQSLGEYISAQDVVDYMGSEDMKKRLNLKHGISLRTAERWMKRMEYRWTSAPKGMYKDGHERADVVDYRQNKFLPQWEEYSKRTRRWTKQGGEEGKEGEPAEGAEAQRQQPKKTKRRCEEEKYEEWEEEAQRGFVAAPDGTITKIVVIWRHDESIFYAHDRRKIRWVHGSESAVPQAKGEGLSRMIIAFVSPDYGWAARKTMRPGKNRDGYYGNKEILEHATEMMDFLDANHPDEEHVLAYDNATTHTARAADALSAGKMPLNTPGKTKPTGKGKNKVPGVQKNWFVKTKDADGKDIRIRMRDGKYADGTPQALYFPEGHPKAGIFKGMRVLIDERIQHGDNLPNPEGLRAQCPGFKCPKGFPLDLRGSWMHTGKDLMESKQHGRQSGTAVTRVTVAYLTSFPGLKSRYNSSSTKLKCDTPQLESGATNAIGSPKHDCATYHAIHPREDPVALLCPPYCGTPSRARARSSRCRSAAGGHGPSPRGHAHQSCYAKAPAATMMCSPPPAALGVLNAHAHGGVERVDGRARADHGLRRKRGRACQSMRTRVSARQRRVRAPMHRVPLDVQYFAAPDATRRALLLHISRGLVIPVDFTEELRLVRDGQQGSAGPRHDDVLHCCMRRCRRRQRHQRGHSLEVAWQGDGVHALHGLVERGGLHPVSAEHPDPTAAHLGNDGDDSELKLVAVRGEELAQVCTLVDGTHSTPHGETFPQQHANESRRPTGKVSSERDESGGRLRELAAVGARDEEFSGCYGCQWHGG
ncbi:hypothetical protein GGX14DRAFT_400597 [Mycena pura]|uniref:Uncharacterized protein n=2 Tax=Mycena pura TaxID=153505 RepID=A0AAD6V2P0_9AGAR|nr:hypothetical protein GGX14DRAFT_400597 [Mycena pura]